MKIAVTSTGPALTSDLDPRFGRAAYFLVVDGDTLQSEVVENAQNLNLPQGAGIQAARTIIDRKVDVLITGNCGPKAFIVLENAGVAVITGASGRIQEAVARYLSGEFQAAREPNVDGHWI
jgi:predicted Fe-Mo cluster-binding NifX family protein